MKFCKCGCGNIPKSKNSEYCRGHNKPSKNLDVKEKIRSKATGRKRPDIEGNLNPSKRSEVKEKIKNKLIGRKNVKHSEWMKGENNPSKRPEVRKKIGDGRKGKCVGDLNSSKRPEVAKKISDAMLKIRDVISQRMLNGGASLANSFNTNPSKPQVELFNLVKSIYENAILNYPCLNYSIDVAIPSLKIAMEYDGSYWHQDKDKDKKRQSEIEKEGWKVIRYKNKIPDIIELTNDIRRRCLC